MEGTKDQIAIYSTNTNLPINKLKSTVSLADLGTEDPMADVNWLKLTIGGMNKEHQQLSENKERVGGIIVQSRGQKVVFNDVPVLPFKFPEDAAQLMKFYEIVNKRNIFIFKGTYDFSDEGFSLHENNEALLVAVEYNAEHNYEYGTKELRFSARLKYPVR